MMLLANVLLALAWTALVGPFTAGNLLFGLVLGFLALVVAAPGGAEYARRVAAAATLAIVFAWSLLLANIRVAIAVMGRPSRLRPTIVEVPLEPLSDGELAVLASLVTLTPGTLVIDTTPDRRRLVVHVLHTDDPGAVVREIKQGFERRLLLATRGTSVGTGAGTGGRR